MGEEDELEPLQLTTPDCTMSDEDVEALPVEYSIRAPEDFVISGPLGALGGGPGHRFATIKQAEAWVKKRYGDRVKYRIPEATTNNGNRWAWLIKGIKENA